MTARQLSFFKSKLRDVSKQLYLDNGWKMPSGFLDSKNRDPRNFTLDEWQQAKRAGLDARGAQGIAQECWAASDNSKTFAHALEERGLIWLEATGAGTSRSPMRARSSLSPD